MRLVLNPFALLRALGRYFGQASAPTVKSYRDNQGEAAIVFVHGFGGNPEETWGDFPSLLSAERRLESWDIHSIGYPSSLRIDVPNLWAADPGLEVLSIELRTRLSLPPFANYRAIAIAAHSMGGLVVQRAVLDDKDLVGRVSHTIFFGTPSGGLRKAGFVRGLKRQFRDMGQASVFITDLRQRWDDQFVEGYPFELRTVAGDRDEFVPSSSSLAPFPDSLQRVVPGNHVAIVKPESADSQSAHLVVDALTGGPSSLGVIDTARLALERKEFRNVVDVLLPRAESLDDGALVILALALDGLGRGEEGIGILDRWYKGGGRTADVLGTLGGRFKRRWLAERVAADLYRARELYETGLDIATRQADYEQAYYHAINIAFLDLVSASPSSGIQPEAERMARIAQQHCAEAPESSWRLATQAEAELILGDLEQAAELYSKAIELATSSRDVDSMYSQAIRVAEHKYGKDGVRAIEKTFGMAGGTNETRSG